MRREAITERKVQVWLHLEMVDLKTVAGDEWGAQKKTMMMTILEKEKVKETGEGITAVGGRGQ